MAQKLTKRQGKARQLQLDSGCTALYIRVSTEKQADEGFSLDAQQERLEAFCKGQGWAVCADHAYVDAGISGKSSDRAAFNAMMQAAESGAITRIVAMKLDRLARNVRDFLTMVDQLNAWGCALVLVKESFDTSTPHGKFALTMFAAMAELEAATITERVMSGKAQKASQGGYNGSRAMLGYDYADGEFTPSSAAPTVRRIFSEFTAGASLSQIAKGLNDTATPTAAGGKWYPATVRYILTNDFYAGVARWDGVAVDGQHDPLISKETYDTAYARLTALKPGPQPF